MKYCRKWQFLLFVKFAPHVGVWMEIYCQNQQFQDLKIAPWERGWLNCLCCQKWQYLLYFWIFYDLLFLEISEKSHEYFTDVMVQNCLLWRIMNFSSNKINFPAKGNVWGFQKAKIHFRTRFFDFTLGFRVRILMKICENLTKKYLLLPFSAIKNILLKTAIQ